MVPNEKRKRIKELVLAGIKQKSFFPIALAIENSSASGIRNLYVELDISATSGNVEVTDSLQSNIVTMASLIYQNLFQELSFWQESWTEISERVEQKLAKFDADKLQSFEQSWRISFEWEALQPQRIRLIKPVLYVYSQESANLSIKAKVFADSFPKPFVLEADVSIEAKQSSAELEDILPDWESFLRREK